MAIREAVKMKKKVHETLDIVRSTNDHSDPTVGSDVTLCQNGSVFIRCRTMAMGATLDRDRLMDRSFRKVIYLYIDIKSFDVQYGFAPPHFTKVWTL